MSYMVLERVEKVFNTLEDARKYAEENASTTIELVVAKKLGTVKIKTVFEADKKIKTVTEKTKKANVEPVNKIEAVESTVLENEPIVLFDNDYSVKSNAPETLSYTENFGFLNSEVKNTNTNLGTDNLDMHNENLSKKVFTSVLAKKTELTSEARQDISTELNTRLSKELKDEFYTQDEIINELMTDKPIKAENKTPVSDDNIELVISQELPVNLSDDSLVLPPTVENDADIKEFVSKQISLLEQTKETIKTTEPVKENKAIETSEEKTFLCDIGATSFPMLEKNVKKQCQTKFNEALDSNAPMERLKAEKETLINWYKKDQLNNIDWFQNMYTAYLARASKKELELATNKPEKVITGEELFQLFESEVNQAQKEMAVYGVAKLDKYKELESLDKPRRDELIDTRIHEIIVRDLVNNLSACSDPEQILKGYSKETLSDGKVKDAIEARKKADIEKLQKLNEVKKEVEAIQEKHNPVESEKSLTGVELAIKEINESTKETFPEITNKHKEYYLVNNEYYEAVKTKEKSFNINLFNELLEEIKDKSDIEVLRITSQVKYTYLANILKEEWDKNIAPIITRALVKELCDELIKTPITKQKELLNKYSKEIQEDLKVLETISDINTKF